MRNKTTGFLSVLVILTLLLPNKALSRELIEEGPDCSDVILKVTFCLAYIVGGSSSPSQACCNGIKTVASVVKSQQDAALVCSCLKEKLVDLRYKPALVAALPAKCSVAFKLPAISNATDCSKVDPPYFMMMKN